MSGRDEFEQTAEETPFDNSTNGFTADKVQTAIEEIGAGASPGFTFSRPGSNTGNTWLKIAGGVVSNRSGIPVFISNPKLITVVATCENLNTYDVKIYEHDGDQINLTLLSTHSVVASRSTTFTVNITLTQGKQLAVRTNGTVKNPGVNLQLIGNN
jgi:hypothetical protein